MLGKVIKSIREKNGLSTKALADLVETDGSHISKIEHGKRTPSIHLLKSIAGALDVSVGYIVFLAEIEESDNSTRDIGDIYITHIKNSAELLNYMLGYNRN